MSDEVNADVRLLHAKVALRNLAIDVRARLFLILNEMADRPMGFPERDSANASTAFSGMMDVCHWLREYSEPESRQ